MSRPPSDAGRLERLWAGGFGDAYTERNRDAGAARGRFWAGILDELPVRRVLEVGCNAGANLAWIAARIAPRDLYAVDVNAKALRHLRQAVRGVNALQATARALPFRDRGFDLVFTMGVLIHQAPEHLPAVMGEIVRCSARFVLCGEYYAPVPTEVPYRGHRSALFKRDFGGFYREICPALTLRREGLLSREEGWDYVTYWLFERNPG